MLYSVLRNTLNTKRIFPKAKYLLMAFMIIFVSRVMFFVWPGYTPSVHTIFELICIYIAITSFLTIWMTYEKSTVPSRIISFGLLVVAVYDSMHAFFFDSAEIYSVGSIELSSRFWILARLTEAIFLILASTQTIKIKISKYLSLGISLSVPLVVSLAVYYFAGYFPLLLNNNHGVTSIKVILEYSIMFLFFVNILLIRGKLDSNEMIDYRCIMLALIIAIPAEFCFTLYINTNSYYQVLGHLLKITYYIYIFKAIFVSSISSLDNKYNKVLNESEERFKSAFDYVHTGVTITGKDGKWLKVNDALCKMIGYTKEETEKMNFKDITHPEDLEPDLSMMQALLDGKSDSYSWEKRYIHKNGNVIWILLSVSAIRDENGKFLYFISQVQDISSIKEAAELHTKINEKNKLLEEAAELDRLKTEFFANLSHEFKTPINVIQSSLQLLDLYANKNSKLDKSTFNKYSEIMKQNSRRLQRLVNNLIDTTKMDVGYYNINLHNCDIVKIAKDVTLSVAEYIKNKGIKISFKSEVESLVISCDPDSIERILLNLLSNSVKFTNSGGKISVKVKIVSDKVLICVKDTGLGIPKNKIKKIFERFHQVDKLLTRNHEGSGIGLSIVKTLVEMHEGIISVNSERGKGSEFIVELPIRTTELKSQTSNKRGSESHMEKLNIEFSDIYIEETS